MPGKKGRDRTSLRARCGKALVFCTSFLNRTLGEPRWQHNFLTGVAVSWPFGRRSRGHVWVRLSSAAFHPTTILAGCTGATAHLHRLVSPELVPMVEVSGFNERVE